MTCLKREDRACGSEERWIREEMRGAEVGGDADRLERSRDRDEGHRLLVR